LPESGEGINTFSWGWFIDLVSKLRINRKWNADYTDETDFRG
jgi:hypothetical protein